MLIDTHSHLNDSGIFKDIENILSRARDAGVEKIIVPATNLKSSYEVIELAEKYSMLYSAIGIHPGELTDFNEKHLSELEILTEIDKVVAIGEIGLDYYWKPYDKELQHYVLRAQLKLAKEKNLPVILHNRESSEDIIKLVIEEYENGKLRGQFHSFSGDITMAMQCIEMGFYISFTGNVTYKPNEKTLQALKILEYVPLDNLLLETDSPYLSPIPKRGKPNEPSYLKFTAGKIAEIKKIDFDDVAKVTTENAVKLFGL
jgi:TatD DNase family protein